MKRNTAGGDLKIIQLFDALDKMNEYDEAALLEKEQIDQEAAAFKYQGTFIQTDSFQSSDHKDENNIDIQLHEQMDHARILYNKGLYLQSLKVLDRMKEMAKTHNQLTYLQQVLFFEKKIEALVYYPQYAETGRINLTNESEDVNAQLSLVNKLSNLSLQLYSWYIQHGHARNEKDEDELKEYFEKYLPEGIRKIQVL